MWFSRLGFELIEKNNMETELGREDISTYVFRRR
jgi:N-acetylglutamate synthase-like GNAT family acetyltransferase